MPIPTIFVYNGIITLCRGEGRAPDADGGISMKIRRMLTAALALLAALAAMPAALARAEASRALTLMVYMCGSNLESEHGAASADLREMLAADLDTTAVSVVVMCGGASAWTMNYDPDAATVMEIGRPPKGAQNGLRPLQWADGAMNMGQAQTLSWFVNGCVENYPARGYALILWDHGGGPLEGVCFDETHDMDRLSMDELAAALDETPFGVGEQLGWIGFDACLMGSLETAHACAPYARYMIASQETEPATGWDYGFLGDITGAEDGAPVGRLLVDRFVDPAERDMKLTLSCVDLEAVAAVERASEGFFAALGSELTRDTFSAIAIDRQLATGFGRATSTTEFDLVDLYDLSERYAGMLPAEAEALQAALEAAVVCSGSNVPGVHGLSLYSPYYNKDNFSERWLERYEQLGVLPDYLRYMKRYAGLWLGERLADWSHLDYSALEPDAEALIQPVELTLTEDQRIHFGSARVVILQATGENGSYVKIGEAEVEPEGNVLRYDYDYVSLCAVDENGRALTLPISYEMKDGYYEIDVDLKSHSLYDAVAGDAFNAPLEDWSYYTATLRCRREEGSDRLVVEDMVSLQKSADAKPPAYGARQGVDMDVNQWPYFDFDIRRMTRSLPYDDAILPYAQWPQSPSIEDRALLWTRDGQLRGLREVNNQWEAEGMDLEDALAEDLHFFGEVDRRRPWSLQFMKHTDSRFGLCAQFIVTDTQGVETASDLISLYNPDLADHAAVDRKVYDDGELQAYLVSVDVVKGTDLPGLYFRMGFVNRSDEQRSFSLGTVTLNDKYPANALLFASRSWNPYVQVPPQALEANYIYIDPVNLFADRGSPAIHSLQFTPGYYTDDGQWRAGEPVTLEVDLDLTGILPLSLYFSGSDDLPGGDLVCRLDALALDDDDRLTGEMWITNWSEANVTVEFNHTDAGMGIGINGCSMIADIDAPYTIDLYAGETQRVGFTIENRPTAGSEWFDAVNMYEYWGIGQIDSLRFLMWVDAWKQGAPEEKGFWLAANFPLPEALPLHHPYDRQGEALPLLKSTWVNYDLRGIERTDDAIVLEVEVENNGEHVMRSGVHGCMIDGVEMDFRSCYEVADPEGSLLRSNDDWPYFYPGCRERGALVIRAREGEALPAQIGDIALSFAFNDDTDQWNYSNLAHIAPRGALEASGDALDVGETEVTKLARRTPVFTVELPEDAGAYATTLTCPLPDGHRGDVAASMVMLVRPTKGEEDFYNVYANLLNDKMIYDDRLEVEFCGLLAAPVGGEMPIEAEIRYEGGEMLADLKDLCILGWNGDDGQMNAYYNPLCISSDLRTEARAYDSYASYFDPEEPEESRFYCQNSVLYMPRTEDGGLDVPMGTQYTVPCYTPFETRMPVIRLYPAADFDLQALFFFQFYDGTYAGVLMPYAQAAQG